MKDGEYITPPSASSSEMKMSLSLFPRNAGSSLQIEDVDVAGEASTLKSLLNDHQTIHWCRPVPHSQMWKGRTGLTNSCSSQRHSHMVAGTKSQLSASRVVSPSPTTDKPRDENPSYCLCKEHSYFCSSSYRTVVYSILTGSVLYWHFSVDYVRPRIRTT